MDYWNRKGHELKVINVKPNTPEWHAHRASYYNASDAAAMLGCSPYETRSQLLHRVATGITPEVDAQTQKRFDEGHRIEALAMPWAEKIINEPFYQMVGTDGVLSASFDGLTIDGSIVWEHKTLNQALREVMTETCTGADLPKNYRVQMQQQLMVSGAEKVLFMASEWDGETLIEARNCWYKNDPALAQEIIEGWKQFDLDRINYVAPAPAAVAIGTEPETLPALFIQVSGQVTASNLQEYKAIAFERINSINRTLVTDNDFADAKKAVKWCGEVEAKLKAAKENALSQTASIDELFRVINEIDAKTRETRLMLNKLVVSEEAARKTAIVLEAKQAYNQHIAAQLVHPMTDKLPAPDFAAAIKGKSSFVNMQDAVDSMLANAKVAANIQHAKLSANLEVFDRETSGYLPIFQDVSALLHKEPDDLVRLIQARIAERKAYDVAQLEALQRANDAILQHDTEVKKQKIKLLQPLEMARRVASEYGTKGSLIDSGNLYAALRQCLDRIDVVESRIADAIHYPDCWDTACYTSVDEALREVYADFKCSEACQKVTQTKGAETTLQHEFAKQTLQGLMSNLTTTAYSPPFADPQDLAKSAAMFAFLVADEMILESEK